MDRPVAGFGFVARGCRAEAQRAIESLNQIQLACRKLTLNEAKPTARRDAAAASAGWSDSSEKEAGAMLF